jgi:hypothetical protein
MNPVNLISDVYDRKARLYPALVLVAPIVATTVAILSPQFTGWQSLAAAFAGTGTSFFFTQLARDAGKQREEALFASWGGKPSVTMFRHRDSRIDSITKDRYHRKLASLVKGTKPPSISAEQADPEGADKIYTAWSHYLRSNTRDTKKYTLVFQENINYGYRRNVWGLRVIGIVVSSVCCVVALGWLWLIFDHGKRPTLQAWAALAWSFAFLLLWLFRFTARWVRIPADAYAERLVESVELFPVKKPASGG